MLDDEGKARWSKGEESQPTVKDFQYFIDNLHDQSLTEKRV